jgi:hypothetical protein
LIVSFDNATVDYVVHERRKVMFDSERKDVLDLTVAERGHGAGYALPAFPLCCSIVLCISLGCSSSCSDPETAQ